MEVCNIKKIAIGMTLSDSEDLNDEIMDRGLAQGGNDNDLQE